MKVSSPFTRQRSSPVDDIVGCEKSSSLSLQKTRSTPTKSSSSTSLIENTTFCSNPFTKHLSNTINACTNAELCTPYSIEKKSYDDNNDKLIIVSVVPKENDERDDYETSLTIIDEGKNDNNAVSDTIDYSEGEGNNVEVRDTVETNDISYEQSSLNNTIPMKKQLSNPINALSGRISLGNRHRSSLVCVGNTNQHSQEESVLQNYYSWTEEKEEQGRTTLDMKKSVSWADDKEDGTLEMIKSDKLVDTEEVEQAEEEEESSTTKKDNTDKKSNVNNNEDEPPSIKDTIPIVKYRSNPIKSLGSSISLGSRLRSSPLLRGNIEDMTDNEEGEIKVETKKSDKTEEKEIDHVGTEKDIDAEAATEELIEKPKVEESSIKEDVNANVRKLEDTESSPEPLQNQQSQMTSSVPNVEVTADKDGSKDTSGNVEEKQLKKKKKKMMMKKRTKMHEEQTRKTTQIVNIQ